MEEKMTAHAGAQQEARQKVVVFNSMKVFLLQLQASTPSTHPHLCKLPKYVHASS